MPDALIPPVKLALWQAVQAAMAGGAGSAAAACSGHSMPAKSSSDPRDFAFAQPLRNRRHDLARAVAVPVVARLLSQICRLLARHDRHGLIGRQAARTGAARRRLCAGATRSPRRRRALSNRLRSPTPVAAPPHARRSPHPQPFGDLRALCRLLTSHPLPASDRHDRCRPQFRDRRASRKPRGHSSRSARGRRRAARRPPDRRGPGSAESATDDMIWLARSPFR